MSYLNCCVPGCNVRYGQGVALHCFPNPTVDMERFRSWLYNIGGNILALDNMYIFKNRRVCHNHFEEVYCYSRNKLSRLAVPTLFGIDYQSLSSSSSAALKKRHIERPNTDPTKSNKDVTVIAPSYATTFENQLETEAGPAVTENTIRTADVTAVAPSYAITFENLVETEAGPAVTESTIRTTDMAFGAGTSSTGYTATTIEKQLEELSTVTGCTNRAKGLSNKRELPTSKELHLKTTVKKLRTKLAKSKKLQKSYRLRLALARRHANSEDFDVLTKNMTSSAKTFFKMQLAQSRKKKKGRRFSLSEKILALSIYKPSPKAYRFLSGICVLPSPKTLQKLLHKLDVTAGFNNIIFENLKKRVDKMPRSHRYCTEIFDEMALSKGLTYDKGSDRVLGFVENGQNREKKYANHALVFMVRGVIKKFKQPLLYTYCASTTKTIQLKILIKDLILKIQECGLEVIATVCDQGPTNRAAINSLIADTRAKYLRIKKKP